MSLELRPSWCLADDVVADALDLGPWMIDETPALDRNGDDWAPGQAVSARRLVQLTVDPLEMRRRFGLAAGQVVGIGARWSCKATSMAGTHSTGPSPSELGGLESIDFAIPSMLARSIEFETFLILHRKSSESSISSIPTGSILWCDSWSTPTQDRSVLLEGDEARIPVHSVSFKQQFGTTSQALWSVDLDPTIELDSLIANVVTIFINSEVAKRDFVGSDSQVDLKMIPDSLLSGAKVALVRNLTERLLDDLDGVTWKRSSDLKDFPDGCIAKMLGPILVTGFGSVQSAVTTFQTDGPMFDRELWNLFAPNSWSRGK
jgi:hypothetical protein